MATLLLVVFVAVVLVIVGLRALIVAINALNLTYRLSLAARTVPTPAQPAPVSGPLPVFHSSYPPIKVLYTPKHTSMEG